VGNALPREVLRLVQLCREAAQGSAKSRRLAEELDCALAVLSKFDEGPDLVLYYKHLMVLEGNESYKQQINKSDALSVSQKSFLEQQWKQFRNWWESWEGK
jgi:4-hydroxy-tetrahydrodipicolinate synthase